jgi:hypothetical protein
VKGPASYGEMVGLREDGAARPRLGAYETHPTALKVAMRGAHDEDPGLSGFVLEAGSASRCGSSSIDGEGKRKRC